MPQQWNVAEPVWWQVQQETPPHRAHLRWVTATQSSSPIGFLSIDWRSCVVFRISVQLHGNCYQVSQFQSYKLDQFQIRTHSRSCWVWHRWPCLIVWSSNDSRALRWQINTEKVGQGGIFWVVKQQSPLLWRIIDDLSQFFAQQN